MKTKTGLVRSSLGKKKESFLTEAAKFVKKGAGAVEDRLEKEATAIATRSTIFGISIGIVVGIVGTVVMQKVLAPPAPQASARPPA
jgi:hypothetical protein